MSASAGSIVRSGRKRLVRHGTIDMEMVGLVIRAYYVTVLIAMGVALAVAVLYLHLTQPRYAVRLYITAAAPTQKSPNALNALSSLAGINLGPAENPKFREFLAAIRSPVAAEAIVVDQGLVRMIFPREWSATQGRWREPHSSLRAPVEFVKRILGMPIVPWRPPDAARVYEYLRDNLKVVPDAKSGIVTLEIDSRRPEEAKQVLVTLNLSIDDWMRQHDLQHAKDDIQYLSSQLAKTTVEELRSALGANLAEQEHARMLASAPLPYVSDMLGTPIVSARPSYPRPLAVLFGALVVGFLVGFSVAARRFRRT